MSTRRTITPLLLAALLIVAPAGCGDSDEPTDVDHAKELVDTALDWPAPLVRAETYRLLGLTGDPRWNDRITAGLDDDAPLVQIAAMEALLLGGERRGEEALAQRLLEGTPEQRKALLTMMIALATPDARRELIERSLRDRSHVVRQRALELATQHDVPLSRTSLEPLLDDRELPLALSAFRLLMRISPESALRDVLSDLRASRTDRRERALMLVSSAPVPDLWPTLRALYRFSESDDRANALIGLGMLGDSTVEEPLRNLILAADGPTSARALHAMTHIPSERARMQPTRHLRDRRIEVRRAALDAMKRTNMDASSFEPMLADDNEDIASAALLAIIQADERFAARSVRATLAEERARQSALRGLLVLGATHDIQPLVEELRDDLEPLQHDEDEAISDLARRLIAKTMTPAQILSTWGETDSSQARYFVAETAISANLALPHDRGLEDDYFLVQLATALALPSSGTAPRE